MTEKSQIKQILHWIGFVIDSQNEAVYGDAISSFADLNGLAGGDIDSIDRNYASRTHADGRIHIRIRRVERLKSLINWFQDFKRPKDLIQI